MKKSGKPLISVSTDKAARRAYSMREEVADLIDDYAAFLSEFNKASVKPGDVIEKLAERLAKDSLFVDWRAKRGEKGVGSLQRVPAAPAPAAPATEGTKTRPAAASTRGDVAAAAIQK